MKKFIFLLVLMLAIGMLAAAESAPSNVVGSVKYPCVAGLNTIALPMDQGFEWASEVGSHIDDCSSVTYWEPTDEFWHGVDDLFGIGQWDGEEFAVHPGFPLMIAVYDDHNFYSIGNLPAVLASYDLVEGLNMIMVPLNMNYLALAEDVGNDIGATSVTYWDPTDEFWHGIDDLFGIGQWDGEHFNTAIGDPLMVYVDFDLTWPAGEKAPTGFQRSK